MEPIDYEALLPESKHCLNTPGIHERAFTLLSKRQKESQKGHKVVEKILLEEFDELSKRLDHSEIQASTSVRNVLITRRLASIIIDERGEVVESTVEKALKILKKNLYSLGPNRQMDSVKSEHIIHILQLLMHDKEYRTLLKKIDKPYQNASAEQLIRETLALPAHSYVNDAITRRAALSAAFCTLRQSVGSCFATAPCILVHEEQPKQFLIDLAELLGTGRLKRTFAGEEFSAPLSVSWGAGDLKRRIHLANPIEESPVEVWHSPGLINALESAQIIDSTGPLKARRETLKEHCKEIVDSLKGISITVEDLLSEILQKKMGISKKALEEHFNKPAGIIYSGLMMQATSSSGSRGVVKYLEALEHAKMVFKSLADNALLKAWEFTIATFTETKSNFSSWNLYASLGFNPGDPGGLGEILREALRERLEVENRKIVEYQDKYEQTYSQVKYMEGRFKRARDDKEARWLRAELQSSVQELTTWEELRNKAKFKAESFANLFDVLIHEYMTLFPRYFQEVYDADMRQVDVGLYDDSPAGFQLLYKHGRASSAAWTAVDSLQTFVDALISFFSSTEHEIIHNPVMSGFEEDLIQIINAFITHIKTEDFLEGAFFRMARSQGGRCPKKPLENLDQVEKKPWSYTSGGSLETLLQCYYKLESKPTYVNRWMESPIELLVFIIDTMKDVPENTARLYKENPDKSMLMTSPTHAFIFKPGLEPIREGWVNQEYTYTWCRDKLVEPRAAFVRGLSLDGNMVHCLLIRLKKLAPEEFAPAFDECFSTYPKRLSSIEFREYFLSTVRNDTTLAHLAPYIWSKDRLDSVLYSMLPFSHSYQIEECAKNVLEGLPKGEDAFNILKKIIDRSEVHSVMSAEGLRSLIETSYLLARGKIFSEINISQLINEALQQKKFAMPKPLVFADTNWVNYNFALVVSPGTGDLELWRVGPTGLSGSPMSSWKEWLDGTKRNPLWEVYINPFEYLS